VVLLAVSVTVTNDESTGITEEHSRKRENDIEKVATHCSEIDFD
jgi:hypothetical protein